MSLEGCTQDVSKLGAALRWQNDVPRAELLGCKSCAFQGFWEEAWHKDCRAPSPLRPCLEAACFQRPCLRQSPKDTQELPRQEVEMQDGARGGSSMQIAVLLRGTA